MNGKFTDHKFCSVMLEGDESFDSIITMYSTPFERFFISCFMKSYICISVDDIYHTNKISLSL